MDEYHGLLSGQIFESGTTILGLFAIGLVIALPTEAFKWGRWASLAWGLGCGFILGAITFAGGQ